jgi:lysophospholipase L1-like esterase
VPDIGPDVIIIQAGVNDLRALPFCPEMATRIVEGCKANIHRLVAKSVETGATVVLSTIFPTGAIPLERRPYWSAEVPEAVREVNKYLLTLRSERVLVFDAYALLEERGSVRRDFGHDTLHINSRGYDALNIELGELLRRLAVG